MTLNINCNYTNAYNQNFNIAHQSDSLSDMKRIIALHNPELILDFGTYGGGSVALFHDACPRAIIHTYDNQSRKIDLVKIDSTYIHYHVEDIFKLNTDLTNLLKSEKKKFIYCDNGNKPKEMNLFVPLLNPGDLIGVHDWNKEINTLDIPDLIDIMDPVEHAWFIKNKWLTRFWVKI